MGACNAWAGSMCLGWLALLAQSVLCGEDAARMAGAPNTALYYIALNGPELLIKRVAFARWHRLEPAPILPPQGVKCAQAVRAFPTCGGRAPCSARAPLAARACRCAADGTPDHRACSEAVHACGGFSVSEKPLQRVQTLRFEVTIPPFAILPV